MATDSGYTKRDYLRVCDICGHRFHFSDLKPIGEMKFACPDDAEGLTALQISRYNARVRPVIVRPNKYAKDYSQTPIYQLAEAQIFNFIASVAPKGNWDAADDVLAAAWATIYMADVVNQDKRPMNWERTALTTISRCLTYLLTQQYGSSTGANPTGTVDNPRYGGILSGSNYSTKATIAAGIAFLKAYQATGTTDYLLAAERCATFIRHVQCGDLQVSAYVVFPSGGGAYHSGGLAEGVVSSSGLLQTTYLLADIVALWFLDLLGSVKGTTTQYGDAAATAFFSAATRATIATMISELTTFAESGVRDSTTGGLVLGLSTTAPRSTYQAAVNGVSGGATWLTAETIQTDDIALALRGLYEANGSDTKVEEMLAWLQTFASNEDNRTPDGLTEEEVLQGITGTYDPALCPADTLVTAAPFTEADGALYDWASLSLVAPMMSITALRNSKDTLSTSVRYTTLDVTNKWLGPIGSSGLSLQPFYRTTTGALANAGGGGFSASSSSTTPPSTGLVFWVEGNYGITSGFAGTRLESWANKVTSPNPGLISEGAGALWPYLGQDSLDGTPGVTYPNSTDDILLKLQTSPGVAVLMKDRNGVNFGYGTGETQARTVIAVFRPNFDNNGVSDQVGGVVCRFGNTPTGGDQDWESLFNLQDLPGPILNSWALFSNNWPNSFADALFGPATTGGASGPYSGVPVVFDQASTGYPNITTRVNGAVIPMSPSTMAAGVAGHPSFNYWVLGTVDQIASDYDRMRGSYFAVMVYDHALSDGERTQLYSYLSLRFPSISMAALGTPLIVRAAKTGLVYRHDPGRYPALRGN